MNQIKIVKIYDASNAHEAGKLIDSLVIMFNCFCELYDEISTFNIENDSFLLAGVDPTNDDKPFISRIGQHFLRTQYIAEFEEIEHGE